jgi:hypothetical protein
MPIDPQDGGLDDWIAPTPTPNISDGPDDWIAPANARRDPYPDDWIAPAPSAGSNAAGPAQGPQPNSANSGVSNPPAARPDPLAAYWSRIPASRAGAMAWHPPIFLNSPGQFPLTGLAPRIDPTRGPFGGLANLPALNAPTYGLLGAIPNLQLANPAAFPSFQPTGPALGHGDQPALRPLFSSLANLPWSPPPNASEGVSPTNGFAIGNNVGQGPSPGYDAFAASLGPDPLPSPQPEDPALLASPPPVRSGADSGYGNTSTQASSAATTDAAAPPSDQASSSVGVDQPDPADLLDQTPDLETGLTPSQTRNALSLIGSYLRANEPEIARIPTDIADMFHDAVTDFPEFLRRAEPSLAGLSLSAPARVAGNVWLLNDMLRGRIAEVVHGRNLPYAYPVIDKFVKGIATSTKTIDLNARSYQTAKGLYYQLRRQINQVAHFIGAKWEDAIIEEHQIAGRALDVLVPHSGSIVQKSAIDQAIAYGARQGVTVNIIRHQ